MHMNLTRGLIGLVIVVMGLVMLLNNFGVIEYSMSDVLSFWPLILIYFGISHIYQRNNLGEVLVGLIVLVFGGALLARNFDFLDADLSIFWNLFWPIVLILLGISFLTGRKGGGGFQFAVMSGIDQTKEQWEAQSGSYFALMGGIELDMTLADMIEDEIVLDLTAIMGGIDLKVPDHVDVECRGIYVLGGTELLDKDAGGIVGTVKAEQKVDSLENQQAPKKIIIQARTLMGGISVLS